MSSIRSLQPSLWWILECIGQCSPQLSILQHPLPRLRNGSHRSLPTGSHQASRTCFDNTLHIPSVVAEQEHGSRGEDAFHLCCSLRLPEMPMNRASDSHCFTYGTFSLVLIECT